MLKKLSPNTILKYNFKIYHFRLKYWSLDQIPPHSLEGEDTLTLLAVYAVRTQDYCISHTNTGTFHV